MSYQTTKQLTTIIQCSRCRLAASLALNAHAISSLYTALFMLTGVCAVTCCRLVSREKQQRSTQMMRTTSTQLLLVPRAGERGRATRARPSRYVEANSNKLAEAIVLHEGAGALSAAVC